MFQLHESLGVFQVPKHCHSGSMPVGGENSANVAQNEASKEASGVMVSGIFEELLKNTEIRVDHNTKIAEF